MTQQSAGAGAASPKAQRPSSSLKKPITSMTADKSISNADEAELSTVPFLDMEEDILQVLTVADSEIVFYFEI